MRNSKHAQWSDEELSELVGNGVVTPEMAEKLRQHCGEVETACGELTRTFCNCAAFDGLETGIGVNFGRRRDSAIPGPCFSGVGHTALRSVMGKYIVTC